MMVIAIGQMFFTDLVMALVGLAVFPLVIVANIVYQRLSSPLVTRIQARRAELSEVAHESFDGALVVKTLGREAEETERFGAEASRAARPRHPRRADPGGVRPAARGPAQPRRAGRARRRRAARRAGRRRRRRRRHGGLPADHRGLPDPVAGLAGGRAAAQRGRLRPRAPGARRAARTRRTARPAPRAAAARGPARGRRPALLLRAGSAAARRPRPGRRAGAHGRAGRARRPAARAP